MVRLSVLIASSKLNLVLLYHFVLLNLFSTCSDVCLFGGFHIMQIALNKPSGLQVLPGGLFQQRTLLTQLQWCFGKKDSSTGARESHPVPVHRLGRGTSG